MRADAGSSAVTTLVAILCACQDGRCFYCGHEFSGPPVSKRGRRRDDQWSRDHVLPLSKGGKLYILACLKCNGLKGCRLPSPEDMRRAIILRHSVDRIGRALQGIGWMTMTQEKAAVRTAIDQAHEKGARFTCAESASPAS